MRSAGHSRGPTGDPVPEPGIPELLLAAVPAPRPELLARVLAGLRDLPDGSGPADAGPAAGRHGVPAPAPLPRRRD